MWLEYKMFYNLIPHLFVSIDHGPWAHCNLNIVAPFLSINIKIPTLIFLFKALPKLSSAPLHMYTFPLPPLMLGQLRSLVYKARVMVKSYRTT